MGMVGAVKAVYANYVTFSGRASRPEFWWFTLFYVIVSLLLGVLDLMIFGVQVVTETSVSAMTMRSPFSTLFGLVSLLPALAVAWRRLHDTGRRGAWMLAPIVLIAATGIVQGLMGFALQSGGAVDVQTFSLLGIVIGVLNLIVGIILIVWLASRGTPGENRFGPAPVGA